MSTTLRLRGPVQELEAAESLALHSVAAVISGRAVKADSQNAQHSRHVRGVIVGSAVPPGGTAQIQVLGPLTVESWNWPPGPLFVGANGAMTPIVPEAGFVQRVATADTPTSIFVSLGPVIKRSELT